MFGQNLLSFNLLLLPFCPVSGHHWKESGSVFFICSLQGWCIDKISSSTLLTRLNSPSFLSLYLYEILQSFFVTLCWNSFQYVHVSCTGGPRIDTALQVWLWQSWVETVFNCFISFEGNHSSWFQATNSNSEGLYPCGSSGEGYLCLCCHWDR